MKIQHDTFEDPKIYKSLPAICDKMRHMELKHQVYIASFITDFNSMCKGLLAIKDPYCLTQTIEAVIYMYTERVEQIGIRICRHYSEFTWFTSFTSHFRNFIITKLKRILNGEIQKEINIKDKKNENKRI